jgi:hypothetical protein
MDVAFDTTEDISAIFINTSAFDTVEDSPGEEGTNKFFGKKLKKLNL